MTPGSHAAAAASRFDVFLSYNSADQRIVHRISERLRRAGIVPFLDRKALTAGVRWQEALLDGLSNSQACAVFLSGEGVGDWEREELAVAQNRAAKDPRFRLIPVLLPGADPLDPYLAFLTARTHVDFRAGPEDRGPFDDLVAAITGTPRRRPMPPIHGDDVCPYRGLEVFDEQHAEFFFGREDDTRRLIEKLKTTRFLAVLGPSGSGKSSLVRAGLVPAMRKGTLPGSDAWTIRVLTPGARPLQALAAHVVRVLPNESMQRTLDRMAADSRSLHLAATLGLTDQPGDARLCLVVDQLEEVFTLCSDEDERANFLANLLYAATIPGGRTVVVVAMRADFYDRCAAFPELRSLVALQQVLVGPPGPDALRRMIEEPAWLVGLELEAGLADTMLADVRNRPAPLPLLEHVLLELWRRPRGRQLTLDAYVATGGVEGALAKRAESVYEALSPVQRDLARRVLLRLVRPGEGTEDTRRRVPMAELLMRPSEKDELEATVMALTDSRLLTTSHDEGSGVRQIELTHEALIGHWPRLRDWIAASREILLAQQRLNAAAREWEQSGRDEGVLYRGARLAAWTDNDLNDLSPLERSFLRASRERAARGARARRRRIWLARLAVVAISATAVLALLQAQRAARERDVALSRQLAMVAASELGIDPRVSLRQALRAYDASPTTEAAAAVRQAVLESHIVGSLEPRVGEAHAVAVSPDGQTVASGYKNGQLRLWKWSRPDPPTLLHAGSMAVYGVAFGAAGALLAAGSKDGRVRIWDLRRGGPPVVIEAGRKAPQSLTMSPDGRYVAVVAKDGLRVFDVARRSLVLADRRWAPLRAVAFGSNGRKVIAGGRDGAVRIWDLGDGGAGKLIGRMRTGVLSVTASPDGRTLAAGSTDGIQLWDVHRGRRLAAVRTGGDVWGIAFSSDGQVAAGTENGPIRIYNTTGDLVVELRGVHGRVNGVAWAPDGRHLASVDEDGRTQVWDGGGTTAIAVGANSLNSVAFSPDGNEMATAGTDGHINIVNRRTRSVVVVGRADDIVDSVEFDPSGRWLLSADAAGSVRLWDLRAHGRSSVIERRNDAIYTASFSPDGKRVVSAGADGRVRVTDLDAARQPRTIASYRAPATGAVFSPDGTLIASTSADGQVHLSGTAGHRTSKTLRAEGDAVSAPAFSPDGREVLAGSLNGPLYLWRRGGEFVKTLRGHATTVWSAAFSPHGASILSGAEDNTRVWDPIAGTAVVLPGEWGDSLDVEYSPDGRIVAVAGEDGTVRTFSCEDACGPIQEVVALGRTKYQRAISRR